jgi:hypothetical protein
LSAGTGGGGGGGGGGSGGGGATSCFVVVVVCPETLSEKIARARIIVGITNINLRLTVLLEIFFVFILLID